MIGGDSEMLEEPKNACPKIFYRENGVINIFGIFSFFRISGHAQKRHLITRSSADTRYRLEVRENSLGVSLVFSDEKARSRPEEQQRERQNFNIPRNKTVPK
jgi:hypothetical protein